MPKDDRRYSRIYHEAIDDPKFRDVWHDDSRLALWIRLLVEADAAWPASAPLPRSAKSKALAALVSCGLIDLAGVDRFRVHGLDAERNARSNAAAYAAHSRWHPDGNARRNAEVMPSSRREVEENKGIQGVDVDTRTRPQRRVDLVS